MALLCEEGRLTEKGALQKGAVVSSQFKYQNYINFRIPGIEYIQGDLFFF